MAAILCTRICWGWWHRLVWPASADTSRKAASVAACCDDMTESWLCCRWCSWSACAAPCHSGDQQAQTPPDLQLTTRSADNSHAERVSKMYRRKRWSLSRDNQIYLLRAPVVERLNFAVRGVPDGIAAHAVQACHRGVARHLWQKTSIVVLASLQSHGAVAQPSACGIGRHLYNAEALKLTLLIGQFICT